MKEIEVLVKVLSHDFNGIKKKIESVAKFVKVAHTTDTYFYDPLRAELKPDESLAIYQCFRLRKKGDSAFLTYKIDQFDEQGKWLYSDENEVEVSSFETANNIVKCLGLKELVVVDMVKETYENDKYSIVIEFVKDLGTFLEVESKLQYEIEDEIKIARSQIETFIKSLNFSVSEDVGIGKPEQLIKKLNIKV